MIKAGNRCLYELTSGVGLRGSNSTNRLYRGRCFVTRGLLGIYIYLIAAGARGDQNAHVLLSAVCFSGRNSHKCPVQAAVRPAGVPAW